MNWVFNLANHNPLGRTSLEDPMTIIGHQLTALGHRVQRIDGKAPTDGGMTILFEGWVDEADGENLRAVVDKGARVLIIATEEPTEDGFNHGVSEQFVKRQKVFPLVAAHAEAIWCLVPGTAKWYGQFAPAADLELGWAKALERFGDAKPDHEFAFFGSITERRKTILQELTLRTQKDKRRHGVFYKFNSVIGAAFVDGPKRDAIVHRGKVVPLIRAHDVMGLVSNSRISTSLHLGRPLVAEPHDLCQNWVDIISFAKDLEEFYDMAVDARRSWRALHAKQMERFREAMSPEMQAGRALRETGLVTQ